MAMSCLVPPQTFPRHYQPRNEYILPRMPMPLPILMCTQEHAAHTAMLSSPHGVELHEIPYSRPASSSAECLHDFSPALCALSLVDFPTRALGEFRGPPLVPARNAVKIQAMGGTFLDLLAANQINAKQYTLLCSINEIDTEERNSMIDRLYHMETRLTPAQYSLMSEP